MIFPWYSHCFPIVFLMFFPFESPMASPHHAARVARASTWPRMRSTTTRASKTWSSCGSWCLGQRRSRMKTLRQWTVTTAEWDIWYINCIIYIDYMDMEYIYIYMHNFFIQTYWFAKRRCWWCTGLLWKLLLKELGFVRTSMVDRG